ncbi:MAG: histidine kinase dimerization/phospho-acceptor domain-containing protein, partial [Myxococcota bacterium]
MSIVSNEGVVLGDSRLSPLELESTELHITRPEIVEALRNGTGYSKRFSQTLGAPMFYVAQRFERPYGATGVVRLALPMQKLSTAVGRLRLLLVIASVGGLVVALTMTLLSSYLMTRGLRQLLRHTRDITGGPEVRTSIFSSEELGGIAGSFKQLSDELEDTVSTLARERHRVEAILENMSEAVLALDREHRITLVNKTGLEILGLDSQPHGRALLEVMRSPALHELVRQAREGDPGSAEFDWHGPTLRRLWARATPLPATGGSVLVMRDVTELRRLETVRRDFIANVSHELRTPVSVIRANLETLTDGALEDPNQARKFLKAAHRNADRLAALVGDLLDISRIEAGQYQFNPVPVGLREAVERTCDAATV